MHRRDFIKASSVAAAAFIVPIELSAQVGKLRDDSLSERDPPSGWKHFEYMCGDGPDAKYRCKLCQGTFWVDACTEENLRLYRYPHKDHSELVPECEWCKLHEGYGMPLVPSDWGNQAGKFRDHLGVNIEDESCLDWADSAIEGHVDSRWATYEELECSAIVRNQREVYLPYECRTVMAHQDGKDIIMPSGTKTRLLWGWGQVMLVRLIDYARHKSVMLIRYSFFATDQTRVQHSFIV